LSLLKTPIDHYVVESPHGDAKDYVYPYAKFYDTDTTLTDDLRRKITRGVFIDVFPIDGIGNTEQESVKNYKPIDRQNILLTMRTSKPRKGRKWWKNVAVFVGGLLPINTKKLSRALDRKCSALDFDKCAYVGILANTYRFKELMPREIYGEPTRYEFEGLKVYGPAKADEYLTRLYGDWRKLPPEEKRVSAHEFADIDLNKPYMIRDESK
jgi:lipopolysaccharide cholinephosphotransferase